MNNLKLNVAHVGGRAGSIDFPKNIGFKDSINYMIFEPDKECTEQIKASNPNAFVYNFCLDKSNAQKKFFLNKNRYMSSFLQPNFNKLNIYQEIHGTDMLYNEAMKVDKTLTLNTHSIDNLIFNKKINQIDFLSLDTQGSELDILKGSVKTLLKNIICIKVEVSFLQLYKKSGLFKDIDDYLVSKGFFLAELKTVPYTNFIERIPLSFRGKKITTEGEALYFLDPKKIIKKDEKSYVEKLEKLAFIAIVFGYIDLGFNSLKQIRSKDLNFNSLFSYHSFLSKFYLFINSSKEVLPQLWHENLESNYSIDVSKIDPIMTKSYIQKNLFERALIRLFSNPKNFFKLLKNYIIKKIFIIDLRKGTSKENKNFIVFLKKNNLFNAVNAIRSKN